MSWDNPTEMKMVFWEVMNSKREGLNEAENLARDEMVSDVNGGRKVSALKKSNVAELIKTKNIVALVKVEIINRMVDEGREGADKQDR